MIDGNYARFFLVFMNKIEKIIQLNTLYVDDILVLRNLNFNEKNVPYLTPIKIKNQIKNRSTSKERHVHQGGN